MRTTEKMNRLYLLTHGRNIVAIVAKSTISRGKLNDLQLANTSTPKNTRAFFVCSLRTPKENALGVLLSMVGRSGQRLDVGCLPVVAVFHPVTFYRQTVESLAVDSENYQLESTMKTYIFNFLSLTGKKSLFSIIAPSEDAARAQLAQKSDRLLLVRRELNPFPVLSLTTQTAFTGFGAWYA